MDQYLVWFVVKSKEKTLNKEQTLRSKMIAFPLHIVKRGQPPYKGQIAWSQ